MVVLEYPRNEDPVLGYTRGALLANEVLEYRSVRHAERVLLRRYQQYGLDSIINFMGLVDNCRLPAFFAAPEYEERYLANALLRERLATLARDHLGGDETYATFAFNRTTAAITAVIFALVPSGGKVLYVIPAFLQATEGGLRGHGHPSTPRAAQWIGAECAFVTEREEFHQELAAGAVSLVVLCSSYREMLSERLMEGCIAAARSAGVPTFVDDASGARTRTVLAGQRRALDLGADIVVTSSDKFGLLGPRAALLCCREEFADAIGAKMVVLGVEARPTTAAAMVRALEEYRGDWAEADERRHGESYEQLHRLCSERFGEGFLHRRALASRAAAIAPEAVLEAAMRRAGMNSTELAPVDASTALSILLVEKYGYLTIPAFEYPGATKTVFFSFRAARRVPPASAIADALDDCLSQLATALPSRERVATILFGAPR